MTGLNKVILMGNLVADPEFKTTPSGVSVTTFKVAVGRRFAKQGDEVTADFISCVAWRGTAEFVGKYFSKGKSIAVVGSLQNRSWTDAQGQKRYITEVIADECYFAGNSQGEGSGNTFIMTATQTASQPTQQPTFEDIDTNEELPF